MAKGKPRAKFPEEYSSEDDVRAAREARAKAPQAKPHRRGGVHQVKDEHLTGTKWDTMTRDDMVAAARDDPTYIPFFAKFKAQKQKVKDLQKHVLLRTLGDAEKELERRAKEEKRDNEKLRKNAEIKAIEYKEERRAEQQRKQEDRLRKEEEGQILSDEDDDENEPMQELPQVYLHQEDSDISDTTSTHSSESPTYPPHRLRIFEWSFNDPPSNDYWKTQRTWPQNEELQPRQLPYTPMNVITLHSHEMLHTPGIDAKDNKNEPDRAPVLSEEVKDCARNGVLIGPLEGAVVESGMYWSKRTIVQGWNGRIYFNLPRPDEDLAEVYRQWKSREGREKRRMDRQPLHEAGAHKRDPRLKAIRKKEQRKITKKVYRASQWRPTLVYLPAYLPAYYKAPNDGPEDRFAERDIKDLFYIRCKGESVPTFFFWAEKDEWKNPTKPNPKYKEYEDQHSRRDFQSKSTPERRLSGLIRVKKVPAAHRFLRTPKMRTTTRYEAVLWAIERDIYNFGFKYTLNVYHDKWLGEGREDAWNTLTQVLRHQLPPSGRLPTHPPVRLERDPSMISIAEKMARVEDFSGEPVIPIYINDDWTRNDDAYWSTEERPRTPAHDDMHVDMHYAKPLSRAGRPVSRPETPAPRLSKPDTPHSLHRRISDVFAWVSTVSTPGSQFYNAPSPTAPQQLQEGTDLALNIMVDRAPAHPFRPDMWTMMQDRYRLQGQTPGICAICLEELGDISLANYEQHLLQHMVGIAFYCPFCNMDWDFMDGKAKAKHVRSHRDEGYDTHAWLKYARVNPGTTKRRLTQTPPELQGNAAVPNINGNPTRRRPSVRFSQTTVGQRTAYNDFDLADPTGIYAPGFDAPPTGPNTTGSDATLSTWRSSSRRSSHNSQGPDKPAGKVPTKSSIKKKSNLTIDTGNDRRRRVVYDVADDEFLYQDAHDSRRKSSSDSLRGGDRGMRVYTYADNGEGWDDDSDSDSDSDSESGSVSEDGGGGAPIQPGRRVGGVQIRAGEVTLGSVVEIGSEEEEEEGEDSGLDSEGGDYEDEQDESHDDDKGEEENEQDNSGYGDESQDGKELDGDSSGGSEDDDPTNLEEETYSSQRSSRNSQVESNATEGDNAEEEEGNSRSPSRKRARYFSTTPGFASSSGVTRYKRRKTSGGEDTSSPRAPTVSPLTPQSSGKKRRSSGGPSPGGDSDGDPSDDDASNGGGGRGGRPASRRSSRTSTSSGRKSTSSQGSASGPASPPSAFLADGWQEWPAPAHLWYHVVQVEQQEEQASDEDEPQALSEVNDLAQEPSEVLEGLSIDEAYALMSVKKGRRRHHIPRDQRRKLSYTSSASSDRPRTHRSPAPSPSSSFARARYVQRNSAVPPNTPAVVGGSFPDILEEALSQPPSPGQLSDRIGGVKTTRIGESRDRASVGAPGRRRSSTAGSKRTSGSEGWDDPAVQRKKAVRTPPGKKVGENSDHVEKDGQENEEDNEDVNVDEVDSPVPKPKPARTTRLQQVMKNAKMRKQGKKKISPSDKTEEDGDTDARPRPPTPRRANNPTKATAAKKPTKSKKTGAQKPQKDASGSEHDEADEPSQDEVSESEEPDEENASMYQPTRPARNKADKKKAAPAPKKQSAKQVKQPAKKVQPRKRMTEAERLEAQAKQWGYID
ncbi:hypothetical protein P171DRAFT_490736 [Karstenula rhodostoma CBS 690.94]|uniref:Uncharacterized protein n=1 Tax=Karstenula rhodostoma CBS 690.94 TaxID=1392251 RepID=A0A9P4U554_9PLEO|nr:hypothetical protein P171DRAFT_490736 [Karstenula rhodostoma CBS 690.94]